ncbi:HGGxSTG domain-containing protein [Paraburkholderia phosphatilytica]|uniref:HGGxSTG domain-containing protein n=1 Tax=Paraburkholderia phosphatilytica TaxID=2282883 RepID=UPI000E48533A|nr:HGGxSTG domain-containing protein [Paraburkholderia phosphatilytica]
MRAPCKAKTRTGAPCKAKAVAGRDVCRVHGGLSTGPKTDEGKQAISQNGRTHGLYGRFLTEEEKARHDDVKSETGRLDAEIELTRHLIARCIQAWHDAHDNDPNGLEIVKHHDREASEFTAGDETIKERVDYGAHYERLTKRLESLTKTRAELIKADRENPLTGDDGPVTEFEVHVVTAENVHLYRDGEAGDDE